VAAVASYAGFRYPVEIISHAVWLYFRFALSLRDVSELMLARGVVVSHETIRQWTRKFGQDYANALRRRRPRPGDTWHMIAGRSISTIGPRMCDVRSHETSGLRG
jgi:putative transposase